MDDTKQAMQEVTESVLGDWATNSNGPVALHLRQRLVPIDSVDGEGGIVYPPTYADIGYNIDTLSDGTKVALMDSVGSQANRMEPVFKEATEVEPKNPLADLVPQIKILIPHKSTETSTRERVDKLSILDIPHRTADSVVRSCPGLVGELEEAFQDLRQSGDCSRLCMLAPTSLVFGVWDSRGGSGEKRPRLVRSVVRAWDVEVLHGAAQYTSTAKSLDHSDREALQADLAQKKPARVSKLSDAGFAEVPSVFRKTDKIPDFVGGNPNPEKRIGAGVLVHGEVLRDVTVNLVALRGLRGRNPQETANIQKYLLGLTLLAARTDMDMFLREGCLLRIAEEDTWHAVPRRGKPEPVDLGTEHAYQSIVRLTEQGYAPFRERLDQLVQHREGNQYADEWRQLEFKFDLNAAKALLLKKNVEESED